MSKITNDSLTWSCTGCFYPYGNSGCQRVKEVAAIYAVVLCQCAACT